jgi:hypothetical protein
LEDIDLTRRNAPCPCGSGKRFKHCHGKIETDLNGKAEALRRQQHAARLHERRKQQGFGKPIEFFPLQSRKAVVIGRSIMIGEWPTFTNFLLDYFAERIGRQWIANEMSRGRDAHPIGQWARIMRKQDNSLPPGVISKTKINNSFRSVLSAAYSLYLVEHHYEQYDEPLFERMLNRLRISEGFFPALSETNTAASFLKAGYRLKYEDDLRAGHHAEFVATYPGTERRFSVEVKTRTGQLDGNRSSISQLKLKNKLSQALKKDLPWRRVVFIDINIPDIFTDPDSEVFRDILSQVDEAENTLKVRGAPAPPAYLFLVNQPFHFNLESLEGAPMVGALGFRMENFQPRAPNTSFRDFILGREAHSEMHVLIESMKIHAEPPSTFDGQYPEFAFGAPPVERWIVGNSYLVPGPNSEEVFAELQSATATVETKTMHGIFMANGVNFIAQAPMTDLEISAYVRSPETFFGVLENVNRRADNVLELAEFFYDNYRNTPKERLLEFLKDHPNLEKFKEYTQKDLAILVSEQWAAGAAKPGRISAA